VGSTLNNIYNKCISYFEIMIGRKKFPPKHLTLEQLRKWWHEVYSQVDDGLITTHNLDDSSTYIIFMDKYQDLKVEWDDLINKSRGEI
jgi:hypothetical protein